MTKSAACSNCTHSVLSHGPNGCAGANATGTPWSGSECNCRSTFDTEAKSAPRPERSVKAASPAKKAAKKKAPAKKAVAKKAAPAKSPAPAVVVPSTMGDED